MNKIYADVTEDDLVDLPNFQWVVLASEVEEMLQVERLRADVAVADCNDAEEAGRKVSELLSERTIQRDTLQGLSVTNILLDIVPGEDGMGEEVYARSVDDVTSVMTKQWDLIEELQEELQRVSYAFDDLASCVGFSKTRLDQTGDSPMDCANQLQQRLTIAEQFVQKLIDCSKNQDSIATGYLSDILDVIKGN